MYYVYVIKSQTKGTFYTGHTVDIERRLIEHNNGVSFYTRNRGPWELVYSKEFASRSEAMFHEKYLKTGVGRDLIKQTIAFNS
jgi:putative endonuclease